MCIQKLGYFSEAMNSFDVLRIGFIFWYIIAKHFGFDIPNEVIPFTFFLLWVKIFKYL